MITMNKAVVKVLAVIFIIILAAPMFSLFGGGEDAGDQGGTLSCNTNLQLIPQSGSVGGGNIHWHLEGEAAKEFRVALLESVGNDSLYPEVADGDDTLDEEEITLYLRAGNMLESYLQRGGEMRGYRDGKIPSRYGFMPQRDVDPDDPIEFYGTKITRSSLNTDSITDDTTGLVGTTRDETSKIDIHYKISFHSGPGTKEYDIDMSDSRIMNAVWRSLLIPVNKRLVTRASGQDIQDLQNGVQLSHSDLLEKDGDVQGIVVKQEHLLDLPSDMEDQLSEGTINSTLRQAFNENHTEDLSVGAELNQVSQTKWEIVDTTDNTTKVYNVEVDNSLRFYGSERVMDENEYDYAPDGELTVSQNVSQGDHISVFYAYGYRWKGDSDFTHWSFIVGTNSYYEPDVEDSDTYLIRTPAGEILHYSASYQGEDEPNANIKWDNFALLENPQVLFVIVVIFGYFTAAMPKKYFKDYRQEYPLKYQKRAEKSTMIHLQGKLLTVALLVMYFFPIINNFYLQGLYLIILSVGFMVFSTMISKIYYSGKKKKIPENVKYPTLEEGTDTKKKSRKPVKKKKKNVRKVNCDRCGEVFTVPKNRNLLTIKCPVCGKRQKQLKEGYNYLLLEEEGKHTYSILSDFIREGLSSLVLTTSMPSKVEEKHGISRNNISWLSETSSEKYDVLDPKRLDFEVTRAISNFAEDTDRGVILIDGLEYLQVENDFEEVSKFIKKTTDTTSMNAMTLLVHVNPESFDTSRLSILKKEFDHSENMEKDRGKENSGEKKEF